MISCQLLEWKGRAIPHVLEELLGDQCELLGACTCNIAILHIQVLAIGGCKQFKSIQYVRMASIGCKCSLTTLTFVQEKIISNNLPYWVWSNPNHKFYYKIMWFFSHNRRIMTCVKYTLWLHPLQYTICGVFCDIYYIEIKSNIKLWHILHTSRLH
jgi:hypothetical protein